VLDPSSPTGDNLVVWSARYQQLAIAGIRSAEVAQKLALQLRHFVVLYLDGFGPAHVSTCLPPAEKVTALFLLAKMSSAHAPDGRRLTLPPWEAAPTGRGGAPAPRVACGIDRTK